jgi:hypothetical protein
MDSAALMEAVIHHALGKQEQDGCQDHDDQDTSNSKSGWLSSRRGRGIRISRHQSARCNAVADSPASLCTSSLSRTPFPPQFANMTQQWSGIER